MKIDKSAVFRDAHLRYRQGLRLGMGWSFARCLSTAWKAARIRRDSIIQFKTAPRHRRADRPFEVAA